MSLDFERKAAVKKSMGNDKSEFTQLVVWRGTVVGEDKVKDFTDWMLENGFTVKYAEEFETLPGDGGEGGRNDLLFYVASEDIPKFSLWRLQYGMNWWEDYLDNSGEIVPDEVRERYPYGWKN